MAIKYYKTCAFLPIYNFYKILDDKDMRFLVVGYSEFDEEETFVDELAEEVLNGIIEEYSELTSNTEVIVDVSLQTLIKQDEFERDVLKKTLDLFNESKDFTVLDLLIDFGFVIDLEKNMDDQLLKIIKRVRGLNNKIRINKNKYSARFKKATTEIKRNLEKEALTLELNLKLGREIDLHKTSVTKWVNMIDISRERNAEFQKNISK